MTKKSLTKSCKKTITNCNRNTDSPETLSDPIQNNSTETSQQQSNVGPNTKFQQFQQKKKVEQNTKEAAALVSLADSGSDDEVYIYPPQEPIVISIVSSSEDEDEAVDADAIKEQINIPHDVCTDINVDYEKRLSCQDGPFNAAEISKIVSQTTSTIVGLVNHSSDYIAQPERANRHSLKRSYEVSETDICESESQKVTSKSVCTEIDNPKRSKRMRKRKSLGRYRGSDYISSDKSEKTDEKDIEPESVNTTGEYPKDNDFAMKHVVNMEHERNQDIAAVEFSGSDNYVVNDQKTQHVNYKKNRVVRDHVSESDDIATGLCISENCTYIDENVKNFEENVDDNGVRCSLVIHPEMGCNRGGETTHNALAVRKEMPNIEDLQAQPNMEVLCYTCGKAGHQEARCPNAICSKCGEKTNTYRRGCERCFRTVYLPCKNCRHHGHVLCSKCRCRSHMANTKQETFLQLPNSKFGLIGFIKEQFALLEQPLGNVNNLYKEMIRTERLETKNGIRKADRARKHLNMILMGKAQLRDGRLHLDELENNLKILYQYNNKLRLKYIRVSVYQHYRYVFSPYEHENYPELISAYKEIKKANNFPSFYVDSRLLPLKFSKSDDTQSRNNDKKSSEEETTIRKQNMVEKSETKTPIPDKGIKRKPKTRKQQPVDLNDNANWSSKCINIVEECRQKHIKSRVKSSKVVKRLDTIFEKASKNEVSLSDYQKLEKILSVLNRLVN